MFTERKRGTFYFWRELFSPRVKTLIVILTHELSFNWGISREETSPSGTRVTSEYFTLLSFAFTLYFLLLSGRWCILLKCTGQWPLPPPPSPLNNVLCSMWWFTFTFVVAYGARQEQSYQMKQSKTETERKGGAQARKREGEDKRVENSLPDRQVAWQVSFVYLWHGASDH